MLSGAEYIRHEGETDEIFGAETWKKPQKKEDAA